MAKVVSMDLNIPSVEIWIAFLESNLKIKTVEWILPDGGIVARARIWNNGALVYDRTIAGPASGAETVPGNWSVVLVEDGAFEPYYALPTSLTYSLNMETVG